jgi:hypothetical protein
MYTQERSATDPLVVAIDGPNDTACFAERQRLRGIAKFDRSGRWALDGCRDMAHWLSLRYGWRALTAKRRVHAAHALEKLPLLSLALETGDLCEEKVLELARFATAANEAKLIKWAARVTFGTVRGRADVECSPPKEEIQEIERARKVEWWWSDGGTRFGLMADLPAAEGAIVAEALNRLAAEIPSLPTDLEIGGAFGDRTREDTVSCRRADALVMLCGEHGAGKPNPATVHVSVDLQKILDGKVGAAVEGGGVVHPDALDMLLCDSRIQTVLTEGGTPVGIGHARHDPPRWLRRLVEQRDNGCCTYPGCGMKRFTQAHHIVRWPEGPTNLENLTLVCFFHHRLIHNHRWRVALGADGTAEWFRPNGKRVLPERARFRGPPKPLPIPAV